MISKNKVLKVLYLSLLAFVLMGFNYFSGVVEEEKNNIIEKNYEQLLLKFDLNQKTESCIKNASDQVGKVMMSEKTAYDFDVEFSRVSQLSAFLSKLAKIIIFLLAFLVAWGQYFLLTKMKNNLNSKAFES